MFHEPVTVIIEANAPEKIRSSLRKSVKQNISPIFLLHFNFKSNCQIGFHHISSLQ
jgi:hypothetical protein